MTRNYFFFVSLIPLSRKIFKMVDKKTKINKDE